MEGEDHELSGEETRIGDNSKQNLRRLELETIQSKTLMTYQDGGAAGAEIYAKL